MAANQSKSKKRKSSHEKTESKNFAFPSERKEPLGDAAHVRNAIARFDQVEGVSDRERDAAWRRLRQAAKDFGIQVSAKSWRSLGKSSRT